MNIKYAAKKLASAALAISLIASFSGCMIDQNDNKLKGMPQKPEAQEENSEKTKGQVIPAVWEQPADKAAKEKALKNQAASLKRCETLPYKIKVPKGWICSLVKTDSFQYIDLYSPIGTNAEIKIYPYGGKDKTADQSVSDLLTNVIPDSDLLISSDIISERMYNTSYAKIFQRTLKVTLDTEPAEWTTIVSCAKMPSEGIGYAAVLNVPASESTKAAAEYTKILNSLRENKPAESKAKK